MTVAVSYDWLTPECVTDSGIVHCAGGTYGSRSGSSETARLGGRGAEWHYPDPPTYGTGWCACYLFVCRLQSHWASETGRCPMSYLQLSNVRTRRAHTGPL